MRLLTSRITRPSNSTVTSEPSFRRKTRSIACRAPSPLILALSTCRASSGLPDSFPTLRPVAGIQILIDVIHRQREQLMPRVTEQAASGFVDIQEARIRANPERRISGMIYRKLCEAQRHLRPLAFADVAQN